MAVTNQTMVAVSMILLTVSKSRRKPARKRIDGKVKASRASSDPTAAPTRFCGGATSSHAAGSPGCVHTDGATRPAHANQSAISHEVGSIKSATDEGAGTSAKASDQDLANKLANPDRLRSGQKLLIPGAKRVDQVLDNAAAADLPPIPDTAMEKITALYERKIKPRVHHYW